MDAQLKDRISTANAASLDLLSSNADMVAAQTYAYDCNLSVASAGGGYLTIEFKTSGRTVARFQGGFAGAFGGYTGWGKAWFNAPVEGLIGKAGAFVVEVVGVLGGTAHAQITGEGFIGNCSTGGIGAGGGVGAGGGKFSAN